jgi:hypothetical protein
MPRLASFVQQLRAGRTFPAGADADACRRRNAGRDDGETPPRCGRDRAGVRIARHLERTPSNGKEEMKRCGGRRIRAPGTDGDGQGNRR